MSNKRFRHLYTATYRTGKPEKQRGLQFEVAYVLAGTSSRRRGAISGSPLRERTLDPQSAARQTHQCSNQPQLWP